MKKYIALILLMVFIGFNAQKINSYKIKTPANTKDRTAMLNIFRAKLYEEHQQEFTFVVKKFNVYGNYAWLQANVKRTDNKDIEILEGEFDCCHTEALFKKSKNKWYLVESNAFSTDVWYDGIWERYHLPKKLFLE